MNKIINQIVPIKKNKNINLGISILRVILSFMVVLDHLYNKKKLKKYLYILYYHIPTFFLISFYFTYKTLTSFNIYKIKLRFERILIPYFSWCTISWILNNFYFYLLKKECRHSIKDFFINLLNGHIFLVPLWFQNILNLLTLIFLIVIFSFKNKFIYVLHILSFIALILQYSGYNYNFFKDNFKKNSYLTLGRFAETFPNAVIGFSLAKYDIISIIKNNRNISFYFLIILIIITRYDVFSELKTFKYGGIRLNIAAICIFILFSVFPFQKITNKILINGIIIITKYTAGIYFTHVLFGKGYLCNLLKIVKKGTLLGCIFIYIISYFGSFIGTKILGKTKFRHLFV